MASKQKNKAIIYARFSPRRNADKCESIDMQLELCREFCSKQGHSIVGEYSDKALSGAEENRPGLWSAIDALGRGCKLIVYRLDRLARSVYLSDIIERAVKKKGAAIVSISGEGTHTDSDEDWLVRKILQTLAEYERKVIAARTKVAMLRHQANNRKISSEPPFGFAIDPLDTTMLIEHTTEQEAIRDITRLKDHGNSFRAICRELDSKRIPCRGKRWHHGTVKRILERQQQNG